MRDIESFEMMRMKDIVALVCIAVSWAILCIVFTEHLMVSLFITGAVLVFSSLLIRKMGAEILLCFCGGIAFPYLPAFSGLSGNIWVVLMVIGFVYELSIFIAFKLSKLTYASVMMASGIAVSMVGWVLLLLVWDVNALLIYNALNMSFNSFAIGVAGAIVGIFIWRQVRYRRWVLEFEYI